MTSNLLLFLSLIAPEPALRSTGDAASAIVAELKGLPPVSPWPGFDPRGIPLAIYDGESTWLFGHPAPPEGFTPAPGRPGVAVFGGQHPKLRANTSETIGDVATATLLVDPRELSAAAGARIAVHEAFHVFQARSHPRWSGNEGELFLYPVEDAALLHLRRLESEALRRALLAGRPTEAAGWAKAALLLRRDRFAKLPPASAAYERGTELKEGLADYVAYRSFPSASPALPLDEFPPEDVRRRAYAAGRALALLLDRLAPGWPETLESGDERSLDELLAAALASRRARTARFTPRETRQALEQARGETAALEARKAERRRTLLARPGWRVVVKAGEVEPLWPQGFDPLNLERLAGGEVVHTRFLKLGNGSGELEVLDRDCLTEPAGAHPLFGGVRTLTVTGLAGEPSVEASAERVAIRAEGLRAELRGVRVERSQGTLLVLLGR